MTVKDEGGRDKAQVQKDLAVDKTPATAGTASGLAAMGSPEGEEVAQEPAGEKVQPDATQPGQPPHGDQTKAAFFTRNGSIPGGSIPSPSGPVPASVITHDETREKAIEAARAGARHSHQGTKTSRMRLSDEAVRRLSPAELRAVAGDRGYTGVEGGRIAVQQKFIEAQKKDEGLTDPPEGHHLGVGTPEPVPPVPQATAAISGNPLATPSAPGGLETPAGTLRNSDGSTPEKK